MPLPIHLSLTPTKRKRIWLAIGCACEICGNDLRLEDFVIHHVRGDESEREAAEAEGSLERSILALCPECHRAIHAYHVPFHDQHALIKSRPHPVAEEIRAILSYQPRPYTPPDTDMEKLYDEAKNTTQLIFGV